MNLILSNSIEKPFLYSKNNIIYKVNRAFEDFTGYSSSEVQGKDLEELCNLLNLKSSIYFQDIGTVKFYSMYTKDKTEKQISVSWESLVDKNEKIYFIEEITTFKFHTTLDNISDEIIYFNNKSETIYLNKAAKDKIKEFSNNINPTTIESLHEALGYFDTSGNPIPFKNLPSQRILRNEVLNDFVCLLVNSIDTTYYEVKGNPIYDNSGNIIGGVVIYRDITHRFEIEEFSILKRNTNHNIFSYVSLSYPDFKIVYINNKAYETINNSHQYIDSASSMIGNNLFDYYDLDQDTKDKLISNLKDSMKKEPFIFTHYCKYIVDVEEKFSKIIFQPIFNIHKKIENIVVVGVDITEEELSKKEMRQALKVQEEIFINTSHELKTPLNLIFSASQLLDLYLKKDDLSNSKDMLAHNTNIIIQNCYRLTKLINNILDISKFESGFCELNLSNQNIVVAIEDIVDSVSNYIKENKLKIIFDTNIEEKIIACDLYKVERIMLNLISNAIKFSDKDGIILVNILDKGDFVEISVEDNGIGIDEKHSKLIFDKFLQIDKSLNRTCEGTGIRLSIVKTLVDLHGGIISLESTFGKGSTFKIQLPAITVEEPNPTLDSKSSNIIEMIKFEFSDIYHL